jgi:hypothetical protein
MTQQDYNEIVEALDSPAVMQSARRRAQRWSCPYPCLSIEPVAGVDFRHAYRDARFRFLKNRNRPVARYLFFPAKNRAGGGGLPHDLRHENGRHIPAAVKSHPGTKARMAAVALALLSGAFASFVFVKRCAT